MQIATSASIIQKNKTEIGSQQKQMALELSLFKPVQVFLSEEIIT